MHIYFQAMEQENKSQFYAGDFWVFTPTIYSQGQWPIKGKGEITTTTIGSLCLLSFSPSERKDTRRTRLPVFLNMTLV